MAPGFADWYLGVAGYESQMTDEPVDPEQPCNLWEPVAGDHGAHGRFGQRSKDSSVQVWLTTHRALLAVAGAAVGGAVWWAMKDQRGRCKPDY